MGVLNIAAVAVGTGVLEIARETLLLTVKVSPYLLLGVAAGAALETVLARRWSARLFGGGDFRPLVTAIGIAALLPGCSCATMPMAAGMNSAAAPRLGTVAAFIFMSPLLSPVTVALTWAMVGWEITAARVIASAVGSLLLGVTLNAIEPWLRASSGPSPAVEGCATSDCTADDGTCVVEGRKPSFWRSVISILGAIGPCFLLGILIAGALFALLPEDALPRYLGGASGATAYVLAALIGIPVYVCEGEEVPITYALLAHGLGPGPSLTFLLGSVGTCIPTMLMARKVIGTRATAVYAAFWFPFAIGAGLVFQALSGAP